MSIFQGYLLTHLIAQGKNGDTVCGLPSTAPGRKTSEPKGVTCRKCVRLAALQPPMASVNQALNGSRDELDEMSVRANNSLDKL
jgi:hypothetical protein